MNSPAHVVPLSFDLSSLVQRSVACLYSHLVTRPTGRALRLGIERQIGDIGSACLSVLDFTQVLVLDYSCADEIVAKLIQRFQSEDRPADAYFIARGLHEQHREPIEQVLLRHELALVAEVSAEYTLLGAASPLERAAWSLLQQAHLGGADDLAQPLRVSVDLATVTLDRLAGRRVVLRQEQPRAYVALPTLLPS
jgi:hypothetical protein